MKQQAYFQQSDEDLLQIGYQEGAGFSGPFIFMK